MKHCFCLNSRPGEKASGEITLALFNMAYQLISIFTITSSCYYGSYLTDTTLFKATVTANRMCGSQSVLINALQLSLASVMT